MRERKLGKWWPIWPPWQRPKGQLENLPPWELLLAREEARALAGDGDEETHALWDNACLIARALQRKGKQVYPSGKAALKQLSGPKVEQIARQWTEKYRQERQPVQISQLKERLKKLPWQRLRWRVLREFGALPTEKRARNMTEEDYLWCAVNLLLDEEEELDRLCPVCRAEAEKERCPVCGQETGTITQEENPAFDWSRFERMKKGEKP